MIINILLIISTKVVMRKSSRKLQLSDIPRRTNISRTSVSSGFLLEQCPHDCSVMYRGKIVAATNIKTILIHISAP